MTDQDLTEHYLLVLVVQCTLLSSGLSSFVTIYIHEITTILPWRRTIFVFEISGCRSGTVEFFVFFRILRGILALQDDATMQFRNAGQRTLGDWAQYPGKLNISNHMRNWGGQGGTNAPPIFFLPKNRIFFGYWTDGQINKWEESGGKGRLYCMLRSGSVQSSNIF